MNEAEFKPGQEVYSIDGRAAEYVAAYDGGHVVTPFYVDEGRDCVGDPECWEKVFAAPPVGRYAEAIKQEQHHLAALRDEVRALREEKRLAEKDRSERLAKLRKYKALERIEDFLEGRFSFFLEIEGYGVPRLKSKDKALAPGDRFERDLKLLTLFGRSNGDLQWQISQYYDGTGSRVDVIPVADEAEARDCVRAMFAGHVEDWRREPARAAYGPAVRWARDLPAGWVDVPDDLATHIREAALAALRDTAVSARIALEKANAAVAEFEARANAPSEPLSRIDASDAAESSTEHGMPAGGGR